MRSKTSRRSSCLIATILSAQCTDERVNMVTPELFRRWPTPAAMAAAPIDALEKVIHSTGFFRNKAKNIKACSRELADKYDGEVPRDIEQMVTLPGVGRKTANVVLGTCYGMATGVVVDTHVTRISNRLGLTKHTDATKIEQDLMELVPQNRVGRLRPPDDPPWTADLHGAEAEVRRMLDERLLPEDRRGVKATQKTIGVGSPS